MLNTRGVGLTLAGVFVTLGRITGVDSVDMDVEINVGGKLMRVEADVGVSVSKTLVAGGASVGKAMPGSVARN